jgi:isopentenyl-diphosphate delta-isomerase
MSVSASLALSAEAETLIPAIDARGRLYPIEKMAAHREGALHQAVSIFVFCGDALLLQRRAMGKYHSGGLWANTCCSHPAWGEASAESAQRRLKQELGFSLPLRSCGTIDYLAEVSHGLVEHERVQIYRGDAASTALPLEPDPSEVSEVRWMSIPGLRASVRSAPERFAPWLRIYLSRWSELGL